MKPGSPLGCFIGAGIERQMIGILSDLLMKCCNKKQEMFETNAEMVARHWDL